MEIHVKSIPRQTAHSFWLVSIIHYTRYFRYIFNTYIFVFLQIICTNMLQSFIIYAYLYVHYTHVQYGTQLTFVLVADGFVLEKSLGPYVYLYKMHHVQYLYIFSTSLIQFLTPSWSLITKSKRWRCGYKMGQPTGVIPYQRPKQTRVTGGCEPSQSELAAPSLKLVMGAHFDTVDGKTVSEFPNNHRTCLKLRK